MTIGSRAGLAGLLLGLGLALGALPGRAAACELQLGFRTLHDLIPAVVGDCLEDERYNPDNGDGLQRTTGGLLVWRKADNWTAFTNGATTWINGPFGLQSRPNAERFDWEQDVAQPALPPGSETAVQLALADAASQTGQPASAIRVVGVEPREWRDASLGCPQPGRMYAQVITPGYLVILEAGGQRLEYHTDAGRRVVRCS